MTLQKKLPMDAFWGSIVVFVKRCYSLAKRKVKKESSTKKK